MTRIRSRTASCSSCVSMRARFSLGVNDCSRAGSDRTVRIPVENGLFWPIALSSCALIRRIFSFSVTAERLVAPHRQRDGMAGNRIRAMADEASSPDEINSRPSISPQSASRGLASAVAREVKKNQKLCPVNPTYGHRRRKRLRYVMGFC